MLEFAGFHARLCRTLLTEMSEFADTLRSWKLASTPLVRHEANCRLSAGDQPFEARVAPERGEGGIDLEPAGPRLVGRERLAIVDWHIPVVLTQRQLPFGPGRAERLRPVRRLPGLRGQLGRRVLLVYRRERARASWAQAGTNPESRATACW
jgi:hypothetical protein